MTVEAVSVTNLVHSILNLHGAPAYALVGALAFAEAALFVGFVLPGETAVLLGGVLANQHKVSLPIEIGVVVFAAIAGDSVGYEVGRHFGARLLRTRLIARRSAGIQRGADQLRERGGWAVFIGRFTAFLRAVMPGLAGLARMPYLRFLAFNAAGGLVWGTGFTLLGYAAGAAYDKVAKVAGRASLVLLAVIVLVVVALQLRRRLRERAGQRTERRGPGTASEAEPAADQAEPDRARPGRADRTGPVADPTGQAGGGDRPTGRPPTEHSARPDQHQPADIAAPIGHVRPGKQPTGRPSSEHSARTDRRRPAGSANPADRGEARDDDPSGTGASS